MGSGLEGHLQFQASSPAQNNRAAEGEQLCLAPGEQLTRASRGEHDRGEQLENQWSEKRPTIAGEVKPSPSELRAELLLECLSIGGEQAEDHTGEQQSKVTGVGKEYGCEQFENPGGEQTGSERIENLERQQNRGEQLGGEQVEQLAGVQTMGEQTEDRTPPAESDKQLLDEEYSRWLKSMMPGASNGWWDVRVKGDRFTAKFRWRGPDLQVIPLLHISREEIEILRQSGHMDAQRQIQDQITVRLQSFLLDSAKCDKAVTAAEKLGIVIENFQLRKKEN